MRSLLSLAISLAVVACVPRAPAPAVPRTAAPVKASFGKTWDAVIDVFASHDISIETLDRSSGLIVPAGISYPPVDRDKALMYADCGTNALGIPLPPTIARFNVVVRGDSTNSTVQVRAFFTNGGGNIPVVRECSSTGRFEDVMEEQIQARAQEK